jgi:phage baseplate assembly protein gpV
MAHRSAVAHLAVAPSPQSSLVATSTLTAPDGATARLVDGAIELRDQADRLLVRYVDGVAEIAPASGNLRLRAPAGSIELDAAADVVVRAARDVTFEGARAVEARAGGAEPSLPSRLRLETRGATLSGQRLDARATTATVTTGDATVIARFIDVSAERVAQRVEELTVTAAHVVERSKNRITEVSEVLTTRAGRIRSTVADLYALVSRRTSLVSSDDTAIDGKRVLLG